jgi:hypothetical protein
MMLMAAIRFISAFDYFPAIMVISTLTLFMEDTLGGIFTRKLTPTRNQIKDFGWLFFLVHPQFLCSLGFRLEEFGSSGSAGS